MRTHVTSRFMCVCRAIICGKMKMCNYFSLIITFMWPWYSSMCFLSSFSSCFPIYSICCPLSLSLLPSLFLLLFSCPSFSIFLCVFLCSSFSLPPFLSLSTSSFSPSSLPFFLFSPCPWPPLFSSSSVPVQQRREPREVHWQISEVLHCLVKGPKLHSGASEMPPVWSQLQKWFDLAL